LDEFLYIYLSLRTHERGFQTAYSNFKLRFPSWESAFRATKKQIASAIAPAGLATQKAARIKESLRIIKTEFGELSLRKLKYLAPADAEKFLIRLPGIGVKSARCIMMYSLGHEVLPVDTHVARIAARLGWTSENSNSAELHDELEVLIPPRARFGFHVRCVQHGRAICRGHFPACNRCCLAGVCPRNGVVDISEPH
jgi:endonuclease III